MVTLQEFEKLVDGTGYMNRRGRRKDDLTIDRDKEDGIYELSNLQVITKSENVTKFWKSFNENRHASMKEATEKFKEVFF